MDGESCSVLPAIGIEKSQTLHPKSVLSGVLLHFLISYLFNVCFDLSVSCGSWKEFETDF